IVPSALASFFTVPLAFLIAAFLWQLLPIGTALRMANWRLPLMFPVLFLGLAAAFAVGPVMERWFFAGDMMRWLDGQIGGAAGGWMMTLLPLASVVVAIVIGVYVNPRLRSATSHWNRASVARLSIVKFCCGSVVAFALALAVSYFLQICGADPRGIYLGTYDPRNALVVGFVMGFAVIPIIYTIADDALHTVPSHLRSGSLGAGATRWQTAVRIVIPTAMSGLFSAVMIGLGRAVGETMIVLMATGNTPVREWNIFNGFRTLAANIAVEVPEAAKDSTHYRTLFLAALTLFVLTFTVNTIAEVVRLRFRRRAIQL
ncbi:MAG: ABC transporter permease subunit, partial [Planctomycetales bacterium]|nr:ABC transporter permease subunit [Planctomycetales bacterium]